MIGTQKTSKLKQKVNLKRTQSHLTELTLNAALNSRSIKNPNLSQSHVEIKGVSVDSIHGSDKVN